MCDPKCHLNPRVLDGSTKFLEGRIIVDSRSITLSLSGKSNNSVNSCHCVPEAIASSLDSFFAFLFGGDDGDWRIILTMVELSTVDVVMIGYVVVVMVTSGGRSGGGESCGGAVMVSTGGLFCGGVDTWGMLEDCGSGSAWVVGMLSCKFELFDMLVSM